MTDDQFQTIRERALDLTPLEEPEPTPRAWRMAIEEHVARVVANLKAQQERRQTVLKTLVTSDLRGVEAKVFDTYKGKV